MGVLSRLAVSGAAGMGAGVVAALVVALIPAVLRQLFAAIAFAALAAAAHAADCTGELALRDAPIERVGTFTNMRHTEEHAYGYSVELWRSGECWFGLFAASAGLAGDTPTGLIENFTADVRTGAVSFLARLTMGRLTAKNLDSVMSRDVYRFSGKLRKNSLRGTIAHTNALLPQDPGESYAVVIRRSRKETDTWQAATFREWQREAGAILERRGPKW